MVHKLVTLDPTEIGSVHVCFTRRISMSEAPPTGIPFDGSEAAHACLKDLKDNSLEPYLSYNLLLWKQQRAVPCIVS